MASPRRHTSVTALVSAMALVATGLATTASAAEGPIEAGITVPKVEGMGPEWINGVDISSVLSLEESGVIFRDAEGTPADVFQVLADHDVNWVRVRVWNDPWTADGHGYGGGNTDAERATIIAKRATDAGMRVLVNFHYSDFWAHPGQQQLPKAWKGLTTAQQRADAVYDYTKETLENMTASGVDVGMVQIGNENTPNDKEQIVELGGWANFATVVSAGAQAVREAAPGAQVAVHFTNPERGNHPAFAAELDARGVDYDVFLTSYYPFWHGTLDNLTAQLNTIAQQYDKDVAIAEMSWAYTLDDGDGHENTVKTAYDQYSISVQGQALAIRDAMQAVANVENGRGIGTFYWEPAWLPVGPADDSAGNSALWEQFGSGWASSYATEYDPDDAGVYYGGSAWDNQALFDFDGYPLESLNVYRYAVTGAVADREVDSVTAPAVTVNDGDELTLPATVTVRYTDGTTESQPVTWRARPTWITGAGLYTVTGVTSQGHPVSLAIEVLDPDAVGENLVVNPGFESGTHGWTGSGGGFTIGAGTDPRTGAGSMHWWSDRANSFSISQVVAEVPAGTYRLSAFVQGGDTAPGDTVTISAQHGIHTVTSTATLQGYAVWQNPTTPLLTVTEGGTVEIEIRWDMSPNAWGTLDDVSFALSSDLPIAERADLEALVNTAQGIERNELSASALAVLDSALARAAFVLASPAPSQGAVDGAVETLQVVVAQINSGGQAPAPTVDHVTVNAVEGDPVVLPPTVTVTAFEGTESTETVTWNDVLDLITSPGTYTVTGVTEGGWTATATVIVVARNLLPNGGFENGVDDVSPWTITAGEPWPAAEEGTAWVVAYSEIEGSYALNGWSDVNQGPDFWINAEQTVTDLPPGTYELSAISTGGNGAGDSPSDSVYELGVWDGDQAHTTSLGLLGWPVHDASSVTFILTETGDVNVWVRAELVRGDWSYVDALRLVRTADAAHVDTSALQAALTDAGAIDRTRYSTQSLAALDRAVERATIVLAASRPTQEHVDAATADIAQAIAALVQIEDPADPGPAPSPGPIDTDDEHGALDGGDGQDSDPVRDPVRDPVTDPVQLEVSARAVYPGDTVTVRASGVPGDVVEFGIQSEYQRLASAEVIGGIATAAVTIPPGVEPGIHHLLARDHHGDVLAQIEITVLAISDDGGGHLPVTGIEIAVPLTLTALLLMIGLSLVVRSRRKAM